MQVHLMRNPPTMLKVFNPELYMDPNNSRTWKIVGGAWIIVFTTLGAMYVRDYFEERKKSGSVSIDKIDFDSVDNRSQMTSDANRSAGNEIAYKCEEKW
eukprot:g3419.t1